MLRNTLKISILLLICGTFLCGCSAKKASNSGFLGDESVYARLKDHPKFDGVKVFRISATPLAGYTAFIIPPVKVYLNAEGRKREVPENELAELAQFFRNAVHDEISSGYRVTNTPGPGVAILRIAITDADPNIQALNIHPGSLLIGGGLGGASAEVELTDSVSGNTIVAALASSRGKSYNYASGLSRWGHTEGVITEWAKVIRQRIDEDNGKNPSASEHLG